MIEEITDAGVIRTITDEQVVLLKDLYENKGWKIDWIALYLGRFHRTSVLNRIRKHGFVRKAEVLKEMPQEVKDEYEKIKPPKTKFPDYDSYLKSGHEYNLAMYRKECPHEHHTITCPVCLQVLGSEVTHEITRK